MQARKSLEQPHFSAVCYQGWQESSGVLFPLRLLCDPEILSCMDLLWYMWLKKVSERDRRDKQGEMENKRKSFCIANQPNS